MLTQDLTHPHAAELLARALKEPARLDLAALAVAALEYPALDPSDTEAALDFLAARVRVHRKPDWTAKEQIAALHRVLVHEEGFRGNDVRYSDPENSFFNVVLARKVGIPISLAVLWLEVARRCEIPLYGVGFPGHFLVALDVEGGRIVVDPFHGGRTLTKKECIDLLHRHAPRMSFTEDLFAPVAMRSITWRMLTNLKRLYFAKGDQARALKVENLLLQLKPDDPGELRARAALLSAFGAYKAALRDVEHAMRVAKAPDASVLQEAAKALRQRAQYLN